MPEFIDVFTDADRREMKALEDYCAGLFRRPDFAKRPVISLPAAANKITDELSTVNLGIGLAPETSKHVEKPEVCQSSIEQNQQPADEVAQTGAGAEKAGHAVKGGKKSAAPRQKRPRADF